MESRILYFLSYNHLYTKGRQSTVTTGWHTGNSSTWDMNTALSFLSMSLSHRMECVPTQLLIFSHVASVIANIEVYKTFPRETKSIGCRIQHKGYGEHADVATLTTFLCTTAQFEMFIMNNRLHNRTNCDKGLVRISHFYWRQLHDVCVP